MHGLLRAGLATAVRILTVPAVSQRLQNSIKLFLGGWNSIYFITKCVEWSLLYLEKQIIVQLVKKEDAFCGTRMLIALLAKDRQ
jgi:hypothetical protein